MTKQMLNVNSQKFFGTHFHVVNELERFLENSAVSKNTSHHFIITILPIIFAVISMNDNLLKFTLNTNSIVFLRQTNKYFTEMFSELEILLKECNEDFKSKLYNDFVKETQEIYKKTVADLRNTSATNNLEKIHFSNLKIVLIAIRKITLKAMQHKECRCLSPLLCDLDLTTKSFALKLEKMMQF